MADEKQPIVAGPTIESLTAELATERQARTSLEELHDALQLKYDDEVAAHTLTKDELVKSQTELAEVATVAEEQHGAITSLTDRIDQLQANPETYSTITVDGTSYEVRTKGFQYKRVEYTVADLIKDKALQKELVAKGVGFLVAKTA